MCGVSLHGYYKLFHDKCKQLFSIILKKVPGRNPGIENYLKNLAFIHIDLSHSGHFTTYASPSRKSGTYCASDASNTNKHPH